MILTIATYLIAIAEAYRNYVLISRGKDPHNWGTYLGRLTALILICIFLPTASFEDFWIKLIGEILIFWFIFDTSLNIMRGKRFDYLSDRGLDSLQKKYPGEFPWFFWKAILCFAGSLLTSDPKAIYGY
jgi:hypothetical protein